MNISNFALTFLHNCSRLLLDTYVNIASDDGLGRDWLFANAEGERKNSQAKGSGPDDTL